MEIFFFKLKLKSLKADGISKSTNRMKPELTNKKIRHSSPPYDNDSFELYLQRLENESQEYRIIEI